MDQPAPCPDCGYPSATPSCARCQGTIRGYDGRSIAAARGFAPFELVRGFWSLFAAALALFTRPEFAGKLRAPILANIVVLSIVFFGVFFGLWELFEWLLATSWGWFDWLREIAAYASVVIALFLALVTLFFTVPVLVETVMGPFLDPLAAVTERIHGGESMKAIDAGVWKGMLTGIRGSAQILTIQLILLPVALLLTLTGIGVIPVLILGAILNAVIWFEIPTARRGYGLTYRLGLIRRNWAAAIGFGLAFQLGLVIPLFNFLLLTPAAAVAVSSLYFRFEKAPRRA